MADTQKDKTATPAEFFVSDAESINQNLSKAKTLADQDAKSSNALDFSASMSKDLENKDKSADIKLKWLYGIAILGVLLWWEQFVISIVNAQLTPNIETTKSIHYLSDGVIITLLTSATANILALPAIILRYLFPRKK